jgi:putative glutathione S-transferase
MQLLIKGQWQEVSDLERQKIFQGSPDSGFRHWIGETTPFPPEKDRYVLYVSYACPFAHRTLIARKLQELETIIPIVEVDTVRGKEGWTFAKPDPFCHVTFLRDLYTKADPTFTGRVTVPVLWDQKQQTIVSNDSGDILRMFNHAFKALVPSTYDFYPKALQQDIDAMNDFIYGTINTGVYKAGFARKQDDYEKAAQELFNALDTVEKRLSQNRYLLGDGLTESDIRLFTTLVRFDAVYYGHFKCNLRRLTDYPHLWDYARDIFQINGVADTVDFDIIKTHYYKSHLDINPTGIVPIGPAMDWQQPSQRFAS